MKTLRPVAAALVVAAALAAPSPAAAQDDEIYINPDSPSGVEYDLPLERARRDASAQRAPGDPVVRNESSSAPFGEGVDASSPGRGRSASPEGDGTGATASKQDGSAKQGRSGRRDLPPEVVAAAARPVIPDRNGGTAVLYGAGGALVVVAGALLGLALRRRRG